MQASLPTAESASIALSIEPRKFSVIAHATPVAHVSAFCRSVLSRVVPDEFWGYAEDQVQNKTMFLHNIDRFIRLRRYESLSLHDVAQGMKVGTTQCYTCPGYLQVR